MSLSYISATTPSGTGASHFAACGIAVGLAIGSPVVRLRTSTVSGAPPSCPSRATHRAPSAIWMPLIPGSSNDRWIVPLSGSICSSVPGTGSAAVSDRATTQMALSVAIRLIGWMPSGSRPARSNDWRLPPFGSRRISDPPDSTQVASLP